MSWKVPYMVVRLDLTVSNFQARPKSFPSGLAQSYVVLRFSTLVVALTYPTNPAGPKGGGAPEDSYAPAANRTVIVIEAPAAGAPAAPVAEHGATQVPVDAVGGAP